MLKQLIEAQKKQGDMLELKPVKGQPIAQESKEISTAGMGDLSEKKSVLVQKVASLEIMADQALSTT